MTVRIKLNHVFQGYTNGRDKIEVQGNTVREALENLTSQFPTLRGVLFDADNTLSAVIISNRETIVPSKLDRPVASGSEITILPLIYGG